jgi:hypothetical protein
VSSVAPPPPTAVSRARGATLAEAVGRVSVILASAGVPTPTSTRGGWSPTPPGATRTCGGSSR